MKARKRIEAVITGTIGNRVVFTGSGVRIPSLPPKQKDTCRVSFCFGGSDSGIEYAATCCRRSHFSKAKIQPKVPACGKRLYPHSHRYIARLSGVFFWGGNRPRAWVHTKPIIVISVVKHPPKCHLKFTMAFYLNLIVKSCIIEKTI